MSKRFINQHCVHCLGYFKELTEDHVFPESWYPDSTPQNMEKWVVPACFKCNNTLGKIEEETYKRLAICTDDNNIAAAGIPERAARLYEPLSAKSERDKKRKEANLKKIIPDLISTDKMPRGLLKNFGPIHNSIDRPMLIPISAPKLLNPFTKKIIRGLEFKLFGKLVGVDRNIKIIHPPDSTKIIASELAQLDDVLKKNGTQIDRGPGFIVRYTRDIYDSTLYNITIWGKWEIWAAVSQKNKN